MASIATLYAVRQKKADRDGYEKRKEQVQKVKGKIGSVTDDYVNAINKNIDKVCDSLEEGIQGISAVGQLRGSMSSKKEKAGTADPHISSFSSELSNEIRDCQKKIDSLDQEISRLNSKYNTEVAQEKEAAKKKLENREKR